MKNETELRDRIEELEEILGLRLSLPDELGLTPLEAKIVGLVLKRPIVSRDAIFSAVYGALPWKSQPDIKTIEVHISKIRRKLDKHDLELKNRYGVGYFFEDDTKKKVRELTSSKTEAA